MFSATSIAVDNEIFKYLQIMLKFYFWFKNIYQILPGGSQNAFECLYNVPEYFLKSPST